MREVPATLIAETISRMCREASTHLGDDMVAAFRSALTREESPLGREVLERLLENAELAHRETIPLCQDCGTAVVFLEVGQEVHIQGDLEEAVQEG
ncbi:MAG: fumarate hydratase, partial [Dehalococcoidia bacterium]|nr:fumarate hydratase [Dehalococcoidia bacterium]